MAKMATMLGQLGVSCCETSRQCERRISDDDLDGEKLLSESSERASDREAFLTSLSH